MTTLWLYENAYSTPDECEPLEDIDEDWAEALSAPEILPPDRKTESTAVCGAEFRAGTTSKNQGEDNLLWCHALVLDVDVWRDDRPPFTIEDFQAMFEGLRFVVWTTFSSSLAQARWRLVLPLASPMPPRRYKALFNLVNGILDHTVAPGCCDPGRLGFLASVGSQGALDSYQWYVQRGERLDWNLYDLEEDTSAFLKQALNPADLKLSPDAITEAQGLDAAKRYYRRIGVEVEEGSRHETLLRAGCKLWWDFALSEEAVRTVLHQINQSFPVPKSDEAVEAEILASFERTLGANRVEQPDVYGSMREPVARATRTALSDAAKKMRRNTSDSERAIGRALGAVCREELICEPKEVRAVVPKVAGRMAELYPREPPERLLDLMAQSLAIQRLQDGSEHVPTDDEILAKIRWQQNANRKREEERAKARGDETRANLLVAFGGKRDTPYTAQELREFEANGHDERQWILVHGRSHYVFVAGTYKGPYQKDAAAIFVPQMLSPAAEKLRLTYVRGKDGKVCNRPIDDLIADYGSAVFQLEKSLTEDRCKYDPIDQSLVLAVAPSRSELVPKFSMYADEWLKYLALDKYDLLCQWLAGVTYIDRPLVALVLVTPLQWGKNLFVEGLSKLWKDHPVLLHEYQAAALERNPVIWCDENLPKSIEGRFGSYLKRAVSENQRDVKRAYQECYVLTGYARHLFTVNDADHLALFKEDMKDASMNALRQRLLVIDVVRQAKDLAYTAADYLEKIGPSARAALADHELAQHVLWLRDNRPPDFSKRFMVEDSADTADTKAAAVIGQDRSLRVFDWIHAYVSDGKATNEAIVAKNGKLYANTTLMRKVWMDFDHTRKGIGQRELQLAVAGLSDHTRCLLAFGDGHSAREASYRRLDMTKFWRWLEGCDGDAEEFKIAMAKLEARRKCSVK